MHCLKKVLYLSLFMLLFFTTVGVADSQGESKSVKPQVELYVTSWCPYCKKAEAYLDRQGIEYQLYDIEKDKLAASRMYQLSGSGGVPFAMINGVAIKGWSEKIYAQALNNE